MSKATGIKGYTPDRLRRSQEAAERQKAREERGVQTQLALLDTRPGNSSRERRRLLSMTAEEHLLKAIFEGEK